MAGRLSSIVLTACAAAAMLCAHAAADEAAPAGAKPLAVEELSTGGVEVALLELKRTSGDTVTAKWSYKNTSDETKVISHLVSDECYLVDGAAKKKYFVVKDSAGAWVAGNRAGYNSADLKPGQTFKMWAKFPAPPASTEKLSVYIEGVAPLEDIPLAK
jgi:hypothetical protein